MGPPAARPGAGGRRRRVLRLLAFGLSVSVLLAAGAGALLYLRLDGNLRAMPLFGGVGGDAGTERPDAFGRTPVNVLVIGSDSRADPADCRLGGDCGPGRNADVEMVLHISADRSHATALSIPRDTVTDLPACRTPRGGIAAAHRGPVNSTLQYGPGCTVAAVHTLTRIPIDHFVMADFAGVVRMSDAVGGVPVCVDRDVYDPYSHLKLAARRAHAARRAGAGVAAVPARLRGRQRRGPYGGAAPVPVRAGAPAADERLAHRPGEDAVAGRRGDAGADGGPGPGGRHEADRAGGRRAQGAVGAAGVRHDADGA